MQGYVKWADEAAKSIPCLYLANTCLFTVVRRNEVIYVVHNCDEGGYIIMYKKNRTCRLETGLASTRRKDRKHIFLLITSPGIEFKKGIRQNAACLRVHNKSRFFCRERTQVVVRYTATYRTSESNIVK
jgi:hypothetical protein